MFNVMIVEDEPVIRNGINKSIKWDSLDCKVVALAENGRDALEKAALQKIHIVISDIMMPEMDGLELSDHLLDIYSSIKIILLTGYKEFDYVKQAMKMGVSNYLLKPTDPDELEKAVNKVVAEIKSKVELSEEMELLRGTIIQSKYHLREKFLYDLMFRPLLGINDISKEIEYFDINLKPFRLIGISIDSFVELESYFTQEDINILLYMIKTVFGEKVDTYGYPNISISRERNIYAIIEMKENVETELKTLLEDIQSTIYETGKFTVSIGVSGIYGSIDKLRFARKEVDKYLTERVYIGGNKIISELYHDGTERERKANFSSEAYLNAIECGENILEEADRLRDNMLLSNDLNVSRNIALESIVLAVKTYCKNYGDLEDLFNPAVIPIENIIHAKTLNIIVDNFYGVSKRINEVMLNKIDHRYLNAINEAKRYIDENYNADISLETVASKVYMSQWYFSKLFKKYYGKNFISYLTEVRIENAKELISQHPELKNYEIAEKIGFISVRYFSELFKKNVGTTLSEYRSKCR